MIPKNIYISRKSAEKLGDASYMGSITTAVHTFPAKSYECYTHVVWHDPMEEKPDYGQSVIVRSGSRFGIFEVPEASEGLSTATWRHLAEMSGTESWAYCSDLLQPQKKKV